jgi:hypothetical protein
MAEEGASQHSLPGLAGLYIGVVELIAILLPGGILAFLLIPCLPLKDFPQTGEISSPALTWVAFAIAAYTLGHLLFGLGAISLDPLYHFFYKNASGKFKMRRERVYSELKVVKFLPDTGDNALDWTLAILSLRAPNTFVQLDRLEADSKFLRSLVLTMLFSWPLIQYSRKGHPSLAGAGLLIGSALAAQALAGWITVKWTKWKGSKWGDRLKWLTLVPTGYWLIGVTVVLRRNHGDPIFFGLGIVSSLLAILAAFRFMELRQKRTRIAYELFLTSVLLDLP